MSIDDPVAATSPGRVLGLELDGVSAFLGIQEQEARWWRDASIAYFETISKRPLPDHEAPPEHDLNYYESLCYPYAPGAAPRPKATCE